jgi:tetratricopeptide (TPR) repeat protein
MDPDRLGVVFSAVEGGRASTSSGYLIAERLFLTAAHGVVGASGVEIQLTGRRRPMRCVVLWEGTADGLDAALLEVEEADWPDDAPVTAVRFGRLATLLPGTACESMGFPSVQRDARGNLDVVHATGRVNPGDRLLGQRWVFSVDGVPPAERGKSPWSGMSGAPLFSGDLLCGVIVTDSPQWRHGKLDAEQVHRLLRNERLRPLLRARLGYVPTVEGVELQDLAEPWSRTRRPRSLAELMRPQSETVRFFGREAELRELGEWCEGTGASVRLLTGSGGQGKTRLALELARRQAAAHWVVVRVRDTAAAEQFSVLRHVHAPLLLVMDYADTRPKSVVEVLRVLEEKEDASPVRVLLLARSAGEWWQRLPASSATHVDLLAASKVMRLSVLAGDQEARQELYGRALADLADGMSRITGYEGTDWGRLAHLARISGHQGELRPVSVLDLQIQALTSVLTSGMEESPAWSEMPVEARLLAHEQRYWQRSAGRHAQLGLIGADGLGNAVAAATLARVDAKDRAIELLASVPPFHQASEAVRTATAEWLHDLYPESPGSYWGALEPDRIGEYHVYARALAEPRLLKGFLPVLSSGEAYRALTVLARAGANSSIPAGGMLDAVAAAVIEHPDRLAASAAYVAGRSEKPEFLVRAISDISQRQDVSLEVLEDINAAIPDHSASLSTVALNITARIVTARRRRTGWATYARGAASGKSGGGPSRRENGLSDLARAHNNYSHRLIGVERWQEASAACERAIGIYCGLLSGNQEVFAPLLASSLDNQATALVGANLPREAFAAIQDALLAHRALAEDGTDTHMVGLARSLSIAAAIIARVKGLGPAQKRIGLDVSSEAVSILSELSDRLPGRYSAELAAALQNQAGQYATAGRMEEAADASRRVVEIRRRLAAQQPDSGLPRLADSLHNYAIDLTEMGENARAYEAINESITIYLRLANGKPDAHLAHLARALNTKAVKLVFDWTSGQAVSAVTPNSEEWKSEVVMASARSVFLYHYLAESHPGEFQDTLRRILRTHQRILQYSGVFIRPNSSWSSRLRDAEALVGRNSGPRVPGPTVNADAIKKIASAGDRLGVSRRKVRREVARLKVFDGKPRVASTVLDGTSFKDTFAAIQDDRLWAAADDGRSSAVRASEEGADPQFVFPWAAGREPSAYATRLLVTEAEREKAVKIVKNAFAIGQINRDELDEKLDQVFWGRTYGDIHEAIKGLSGVECNSSLSMVTRHVKRAPDTSSSAPSRRRARP